ISAWPADALYGGGGKDIFFGGTVKDLKKGETAEPFTLTPPDNGSDDPPTHDTPPPSGEGLAGTYFNSLDFSGTPVTRSDWGVDFNWHANGPIDGVKANGFSARWR